MSSRKSISEDWEDMGDDNLSVISLPCSESSLPASPSSQPTPPNIRVDGPAQGSPQTPSSIRSADTRPVIEQLDSISETTTLRGNDDTKASLAKGKLKEVEPTEVETLENPFMDPPGMEEVDDDAVDELFDDGSRDVDPQFLLKTLQSLRGILDNTLHVFTDLAVFHRSAGERSLDVCQRLSRQVSELMPIISGYEKVWPALSRDIPLDPGLHGWLSGVRVKVLSLQAEAQTLTRRDRAATNTENAISKILEDLSEHETKMGEFLPIMQADFDEFQTKHMAIPITGPPKDSGSPTAPTNISPIRSAPIDIPQSQPTATSPQSTQLVGGQRVNRLFLLRRALYELKDMTKRTVQHLGTVTTTGAVPPSVVVLAGDVARTYDRLFSTIGWALSNHGSDWIESGIAGGLTYAEFSEMSVDTILSLAARLGEILRDVRERAVNGGVYDTVGWREREGERYEENQEVMDPFGVVGAWIGGAGAADRQSGMALAERRGRSVSSGVWGIDCEQVVELERLGQVLEVMFRLESREG
ncbi:hypothetical protein MMYC01_202783 [Madurella mycetomatis]|uniref:Uncharacterized protein n=1 Tax=Madurella mycetomatis TaxID=100816 RepID=A0A175WC23_9PEZI|nr:hypothetical protein MMYC01_202783 [Madurella mycetomatis]